MVMTDGEQIISLPPATQPIGPIPGLDSAYAANWMSVSFGMELSVGISDRVMLETAVYLYPSLYYAAADWNLRTDLAHPVSFVHRTFGGGLNGDLSVEIVLSRRLLLKACLGIDYWFGAPGVVEFFPSTGGSDERQLNEVVWKSAELGIGTVLRL
jgi:hypothetical protein